MRKPIRHANKNTLLNKNGLFIGFGHGKHPDATKCKLHVCVFLLNDKQYVITLTDVHFLEENLLMLRSNLGHMFPGSSFANAAVRSIDGRAPYDEVKKVFEQSFPTFKFEWLEKVPENVH